MSTPLQIQRHAERGAATRDDLLHTLRSTFTCVVSSVVDGSPWALPLVYAVIDDHIVIHGSTGAGLIRHLVAEAPAVVTVFTVQGLVLGASTTATSVNFESATVAGLFEVIPDGEKAAAMDALTDAIVPGRSGEVRASTAKEWAAIHGLRLRIGDDNWSLKRRSGGPGAVDAESRAWQGVLPCRMVWDAPLPMAGLHIDATLPHAAAVYGSGMGGA